MRRAHRDGMRPMTAGVIALVLTAIAVFLGFSKSVPFRQHFEVRGVFETGNNITKGSLVRVAGVNVGKVVGVEHARDGGEGAVVTMRINREGRPIHKDARLTIRPRIFLEGNFFVDVEPGTPSAPELEDGDVIPVNQTSTPVQIDQILTALQTDTRDDLRVLLREYASALKGRGARGFNRSIEYWEEAYRDGAIVSDASLGIAEHDLSEYERSAATVAEALDRSPEALKALITDFNATARGFAAESERLRQSVAELPRTLRAAQPALGALNDSFPAVRALARELRPGVRNSVPAIDASLPLVRELRGLMTRAELRGLVADLRPGVPVLARLTERSVPVARQSRRAAACTNEVLVPWARDTIEDPNFPASGRVYEEAPKIFPGLAGESRSGDSNGQWFRVLASGGTNLIQFGPGLFATSALPINGANPPKPKGRAPLNPDAPCEDQQPPDLRTTIAPPPPQRRVDTGNPRYVARLAKARTRALRWLKGQLRYEGLTGELKVGDRDVSASEIAAVAKRTAAERAARRARILGASK